MFDVARTLHAAVERDPAAVALVDGDVTLTYAQLLDRAGRIAAGLRRRGLGRGDHLLVVMQNRWESAVLHWACQLAAIIATPVNWRAKSEEIDYFVENAEAKAVVFEAVSAPSVGAAAQAARLGRITVGACDPGDASFEDWLTLEAETVPRALPEDVSLMLYTSGTTGRGKGVPRRHRAERAAAVAHVAQNKYGFGERTLGVMPLYHTMGVRSLLAMAVVNGTFVCLPRFDAGRALELIEREKITCLYLVPTLYHDILDHRLFGSTDTSSVRKLGFAGASMTAGLAQRLTEAFRPDLFVNHYGSSEIYTFTICGDVPAKPGSAGKAGLNQIVRVVKLGSTDPDDRVEAGAEGQIIASLDSDEAFEGYWRRPEADAKSIHQGWYFTGDIGWQDKDGDLFVTGRVDDMIVTGGENVLPVEIESILSLYPGVAEVVVAGLPDERWGQRVAAFVRTARPVAAEDLDRYCRQSGLADFKRPRQYLFVDAIPKSPVGKILRRLLVAGAVTINRSEDRFVGEKRS
jgi:2-furoate---CoA ligase